MILGSLGIHLEQVMVSLKKPLVICGFTQEQIGTTLGKYVVTREFKEPKVFRV